MIRFWPLGYKQTWYVQILLSTLKSWYCWPSTCFFPLHTGWDKNRVVTSCWPSKAGKHQSGGRLTKWIELGYLKDCVKQSCLSSPEWSTVECWRKKQFYTSICYCCWTFILTERVYNLYNLYSDMCI